MTYKPPMETARLSEHLLRFEAVEVDLYELDGLLWLRRGQVEAVIGAALPITSGYYERWHGPYETRLALLSPALADDAGAARLFTLYGAATLAKRIKAPKAALFCAEVDRLAGSPHAPPGAFMDQREAL